VTSEEDAAALRQAFNRAAETFPTSVVAFLRRNEKPGKRDPGTDEAERLMAWWAQFYDAIRDTTAGLSLLAELQALKTELETAHQVAWNGATKAAIAKAERVAKCYADSSRDCQRDGDAGEALVAIIKAAAARIVVAAIQREV
jgi:hypothetical protein